MRRRAKLAIIIIHCLIALAQFGFCYSEIAKGESKPTSATTDSSAPELTTDTLDDAIIRNSTDKIEVPSSSSSTEAIDQNATKPGPLADDTFLWRLIRRTQIALGAFPVYVIGSAMAYSMSFDACPTRHDDFWLQQYCTYGHYLFLALLILFAPVWFFIGPIVFFIFVGQGPYQA